MYKLLIVEDEVAIREGIIRGMDWQSMGFEVAGAASNGLEAIESVNSNPPDLILTDIRMPQMDGLELIEKTRLLYPDIRFVVLSGYSDFEYVQTALKNKVVDYLLKPTDIKEFETTFQRISRELDEERSRKYEYEVLKKQLRDSLPLLRDRFLYELVQGCSYDIDAISRKIKYLELDLNIGHARAAVFEIDSLSAEVNYLPEDEKNLLIFSITNIAQEITGTRLKCICFAGSDRIIIVFNTIVENEQLQEILIQIQECIKKYLKKTVSAGIGRLYANIKMLPVSYKEALEALKYKIYTGQESIVFIDDVQEKSDDLEMPSEHELEGAINCFHSEDESCLRKEIDRLFEKYINRTLKPLNYVDNLCLHILFTVSRYVEKTSTGIEDIFACYDFKDIFRFDTIAAKKDCLIKFLANIRVSFNNGSKSSIRKIVVKILEYIDKNYCNSNISLNLIAEEFNKSSVYVSKLFKAETGENFIDYVTNLRIKKARGLLADSLNLKVFEISQIVGYNDVSHFSKLFKKYTGLSPIEYRERSRPNNG